MIRTLQRAVTLLEEHGIRALPYKGPSLSAIVHDDVALRGSKDLDLLLPKTEVLTARELLIKNGFRAKQPLTAKQKRTKFRGSRHTSVVSEDGIRIELHWRVTEARFPFKLDFEKLWRTRESVDIGNGTLPMISLDELVLLLAVHGNRHCWSELAWLCDFAGVVTADDFDWHERLEEAAHRGAERMLLVGLQLAHDLAGVDCPSIVHRRIRADTAVTDLVERVVDSFLWTEEQPAFARPRYKVQVREQPMDKLRTVARQAVVPRQKDLDALPPHAQFYPIAVLFRPIRLGSVIGSAIVNRLRQRRM